MHIRPTPKLRRLSVALLAAIAMPALAQQAPATDTQAQKTLDQVTVTGSRIKRTDVRKPCRSP